MCIILTCEPKVRPSLDLIYDCFFTNPDGAGIMWCEGGFVRTAKGFMDEISLIEAIDEVPIESPLVIHMRIATSGGVTVGTCHPFPVSDDLELLHASLTRCPVAIAHNGVIANMPTDKNHGISDTISFVSGIVTDLLRKSNGVVTNEVKSAIREAAPGNRFAIMTGNGKVFRMGSGWETVTTGIEASNSTWRYAYLSSYDWDDYLVDYGNDVPEYGPEFEWVFDSLCGCCKAKASCMMWGPTCDDVADSIDSGMFSTSCEDSTDPWHFYSNSTSQRYGYATAFDERM